MKNFKKTNLYLLSIVGIVAVVGIVVLVLSISVSVSADLTGQAINIKKPKVLSATLESMMICRDTDGGITDLDYVWYETGDIIVYGHDEFTKGTTSGLDRNGKYVRMEDICGTDYSDYYGTDEILEGHCLLKDDGSGYYATQGWDRCAQVCEDGACVED